MIILNMSDITIDMFVILIRILFSILLIAIGIILLCSKEPLANKNCIYMALLFVYIIGILYFFQYRTNAKNEDMISSINFMPYRTKIRTPYRTKNMAYDY